MDANSKMNFLNNIPAGEVLNCPACGAANKATKSKCFVCGAALKAGTQEAAPADPRQEMASLDAAVEEKAPVAPKVEETLPPIGATEDKAPAFGGAKEELPPIGKVEEKTPAFGTVEEKKPSKGKTAPKAAEPEEESEVSAFAQGLPKWSLEPPQIAIRRR